LRHDLAGKVALVTGGSRGIGAAVARALASAGADVALTYLNSRQAAENVAAEMRALGVRAQSVRADQADPAAASAVVRQVAGEFGRLDILVNNAAVAVLGPIDGPVPNGAALDRQIRVNYTNLVAAIRAAAHLLPDGAASSTSARGSRRVPAHQGSPTTRAQRRHSPGSPAARRVTWPPRASPSTCYRPGPVATQLNTAAGSTVQRIIASVPLGWMAA
jgi:NAD(P)-dependent dehydrogenase (short-subunit alcohol dehydrogenase family)